MKVGCEMALLEIFGLNVSYGRTKALSDIALTVESGQIATILGANGAGKSSLLKTIIGNVKASSGQILFKRRELTTLSSYDRVKEGVVLVPEGRRILIEMSIEENFLLGGHMRKDKAALRKDMDELYQRFPNLGARRHMLASCLSGGEQQMLAIGRALLAKPDLIMLDEPSLGLSPLFVEKLFELICEMRDKGLTVLLVEQNTGKALNIADTATVLELGTVVMKGNPKELMKNEDLQRAYLGSA